MTNPIAPVRIAPVAPQSVAPQGPAAADRTIAPLTLAPVQSAAPRSARTISANQTPVKASDFGPQFSFSGLTEQQAVSAAAVALSSAQDNVASSGFVVTPHDFQPILAFKDELGRTSVRMNRVYDGIPIYGAQAIAHLDETGKVASFTGAPIPARLPIESKARISPITAKANAVAASGATNRNTSAPSLCVIATDDGVYHLAYHVIATVAGEPPRRTHVFVDATNGGILPVGYDEPNGILDQSQVNELRRTVPRNGVTLRPDQKKAIPPGFGQSLYSGVVPLATQPGPQGFMMHDPASGNETRDANNAQSMGGIFGGIFARPSQAFTDNNNQWGEPGDNPRAQAGIDAHFASVRYLGYLREVFNRNSIDDRGFALVSNVHMGNNLVNAFWNGTSMNYGDGDGRVAGPLVDADVGGHEITHGLTSKTSALVYRGESGALNEAGSDIMGSAGFAWYLRGRRDQGIPSDYLIGEATFTPGVPGDALRYMDVPGRDRRSPTSDSYSRAHVSEMFTGDRDRGGVHLNSGIANNFFYLMANGGENPISHERVERGLGIEKALRIYYRAHTVYFTPSTNFAQARVAWERAATDLFGANSQEVATVRAAAQAVGIQPTAPSFRGVNLVS